MALNGEDVKLNARVIIVGAGPVGLLAALRLGQAGIDTLVIEGHDHLLPTTRATVYMPVVNPVLRELGILDLVAQHAYLNTEGIAWRDLDGKLLAQLPLLSSSSPDDSGAVLLIGQSRMNSLILQELQKYPSVQVRFNCKLASLENDASSQKVTVRATDPQSPSSPEIVLTASYVLGTDGANSMTRRLLGLDFEGFTYTQFRMIGIDLAYDFIKHENITPLNFIVHPTDWAVIAYTGQDEAGVAPSEHQNRQTDSRPQWRVAYVESPDLPDDQDSIRARARKQVSKYIRSSDGEQSWTILRAEPYTMSQRHASAPIVHRVALAGDALHSNNPIGGLGLTGGILDAFCYGNALVRTIRGDGSDRDLLKRCAESRLQAWKDTTDVLSQTNIARLFATDHDTAAARDALFQQLNGPHRDAVAAKMRQGIDHMLGDDFADGVDKWIAQAS